ncbi:MAG: SURF1 family protein [Arachnia sp.]
MVVAAVMLLLGLWQMASYEESTRDVSAERAALDPVPLADQVGADGVIKDVYGRRVTLHGEYLADHQVVVGEGSPWRVATAFRMTDGRIVPVVRGTVEPGAPVPPPPSGEQDVLGIFLAPDKASTNPPVDGGTRGLVTDLPTLRVQELAQTWPSPLVGGYVTLPADASATQGLGEAFVILPEAEGSATHRGYALQWWVFAAGAVAFGIYTARSFQVKETKAARADAGT